MLYLRYYLHKFFPLRFAAPQVLKPIKFVVRPARRISTTYQLLCKDSKNLSEFLKEVRQIPVVASVDQTLRTEDGYSCLFRIVGNNQDIFENFARGNMWGVHVILQSVETEDEISKIVVTKEEWTPNAR